jgi:nitroreductase
MDPKEIIIKRRSIRKFKDQPVNLDTLTEISKYALLAPSGMNSKPVDLVIVTEKEKIKQIMNSRKSAFSFLKTSPACIVVTSDQSSSTWISDASIVATYVQFLTVEYGLGSCWGHVLERYQESASVEETIKNILSIRNNYRVLCVIGIGYPDEIKSEHTLDEVKRTKLHYNNW